MFDLPLPGKSHLGVGLIPMLALKLTKLLPVCDFMTIPLLIVTSLDSCPFVLLV